MAMEPGEHRDALEDAIRLEGEAHRALLAGDEATAGARLAEAAGRYRTSWEVAPPRSFGRLIGMLKALIIAGADAVPAAAYVRAQVGEEDASPPAWYALAIAGLVTGDDDLARRAAEGMRPGLPAFGRTADAVDALARRDGDAYADALRAIVADFEARDEHLTGVPIADTALMLERLAEARGLAARPGSALLPPTA
jgi:hypothetical protein